MDTISKTLFASALLVACIDIIKLYNKVENLEVEIHGTQRYIRKECVTDCDLMRFKDGLTKNSTIINVGDKKGTNE